jgi:hypothetical protein
MTTTTQTTEDTLMTFRNTIERFGDTTTTYTAESPEALATEINELFCDGAVNDWMRLDGEEADRYTFCVNRALQLRDAFINGLEIVD